MTAQQVPPDRAGGTAVADPPGRSGAGAAPGVVAFVLQGGGSLCAPQVGMLRALVQAGIRPDLLVGSSAGALNAVAFAADPSTEGLDRLGTLWTGVRRRHIAPISVRTIARAVAGRTDGVVPSTALRELLRSGITVGRLEETAVAAHVVATDTDSGEAVVISEGDAVSALLASAAFPGLYPPVRIGEHRLVDGGVAADVPVLQAEALGATTIYVLPAARTRQTGPRPHAALSAAYRALGQILDELARRDSAAVRGRVCHLPAVASPVSSLVDFRDTRRLVEAGYRAACDWLECRPAPRV